MRDEIGRLKYDVRRSCRDAAGEAAHHTGQCEGRTRCVGNDKIIARERVLGFVERSERLAIARMAHDQAAADLCRIECVKRLTHLMQDKIRDIDDVVDRPQPDRFETFFEPCRAFLDRYA